MNFTDNRGLSEIIQTELPFATNSLLIENSHLGIRKSADGLITATMIN